jgi:cellulose biosynthesis protein BcsQ
MPSVIAIDNNKGGVGKTLTTIELATWLAAQADRLVGAARQLIGNKPQLKVAAVDCDSNIALSSLTIGLADPQYDSHRTGKRNLLDALTDPGKGFDNAIVSWDFGGGVLDIIPGSRFMENAPKDFEHYLDHGGSAPTHHFPALMYRLIQHHLGAYQFVILDVGPGQNDVMESAIIGANKVIIPMEPALASVRGLNNFAERVELANTKQAQLPAGEQVPPTDVAGVLISRMSPKSKAQARYARDIRRDVPCFTEAMHETDETKDLVAEAIEAGHPVWFHFPESSMARQVANFSVEVARQFGIAA